MLFKTLGAMDFVTVLILLGAAILPHKLLLFAAIYMIAKGLIFIMMNRDFASYGDFVSGVYLLIMSFGIIIPVVHSIVLFWLIQKTALTFIAIGFQMFLLYHEYKEELPSFLR
jgi:hypothetical protein